MTTKVITKCAECPAHLIIDPDPRPEYERCLILDEDTQGAPLPLCPWRPENGGPVTIRLAEGV